MNNSVETQTSAEWPIALSSFMVLLGIIAISLPFIIFIPTSTILGWLFLSLSLFKFIYVFKTRDQGGFELKLLLPVLYLATGITLLETAYQGYVTLTLLLGIFLVAEGVTGLLLAAHQRSLSSRLWIFFDGLLGILLGGVIWAEWTSTIPWMIEVLVGLRIMSIGISRIMLSVETMALETRSSAIGALERMDFSE